MKILSLILALSLLSSAAFGTVTTLPDGTVCDWSKTIHNADGTVTYPASLHMCVGKVVQDDAVQTQKVADLTKAVNLYQLTIQTDEQRIQNLMVTLNTVQDRVDKAEDLQKKNELLYIGLGVLGTCAAAYVANKVSGH